MRVALSTSADLATVDPGAGLRVRWTWAFVLGELVGFIPPAMVGTALGRAGAGDAALVLGLALAGALEGAAIGFTGSRVLARYLPDVDDRAWIIATSAAAAFAWAVGMGGPALLTSGIPVWLGLVVMVPAWIAALLAMGVAQWLVLRRVLARCVRWIPATAGAWLVGVMIPVAAISLTPEGTPAWAMVAIAVTAAIAMGITVGVLTGGVLVGLIRRHVHAGVP
jgi:hypothetical protein